MRIYPCAYPDMCTMLLETHGKNPFAHLGKRSYLRTSAAVMVYTTLLQAPPENKNDYDQLPSRHRRIPVIIDSIGKVCLNRVLDGLYCTDTGRI